MEQEHQQLLIVHDGNEEEEEEEEEEVEDVSLKRTLPHGKDNLVTCVVTSSSSSNSSSSSSSPASNGGGHSNGVSTVVTDPNGSSLQKEEEVEEIENVGENSNHFSDDFAAVGLGLVAEFVGAETNGGAITGATFGSDVSQNKNSVYFDKQQGVWKCHHCTWTKRFDSPWTVPIWNLKGYPDLQMNVKTMIQHGPCFVWETKGNEVNGLNTVQNGDATRFVFPTKPEESEFDVQVENSAIQNSLCSDVNDQCMKTVDDKVPSSSELSALHNSSDIQTTDDVNFHEETIKEGNLIEEIDQQVKEFDVEVVLAKQETHDLFCPKCKSCITKRVILKKRKRNISKLDNEAKRDKLDTVVNVDNSSAPEANQDDHANVTSEITSPEPPADNDHPEREVELFGCLSCLSIFIPSGKGFNLFRKSGGASKHETSQNPSSITARDSQNPSNLPGSNANWFTSLFTSKKEKTATEQGNISNEHSGTGPSEQHHSTSTTSSMLSSVEIGHPEGPLADTTQFENSKAMSNIIDGHKRMNSSAEIGHSEGPLADTTQFENSKAMSDIIDGHKRMNSLISSNEMQCVGQDFVDFSAKEQSLTGKLRTNEEEKRNTSVYTRKTNNVEVMSSMSFSDGTVTKYESVKSVTSATSETLVNSGEATKDAILSPCKKEPEFLVPTTVGSPILEKSQKDVDKTPEIVKNSDFSLRQGAQSQVQPLYSTVVASDVASNKQISGIDAKFPSKPGITPIDKAQQDIGEEINPSVGKENKGDVIVVVEEESTESTTFQTTDNVTVDGAITTGSQTQVGIGEQPRDEIGEPRQLEIVKSIVYGGLVESITSLGIVSSAASSGATPLNIIALGFANLIGGLFILGHNLKDLKNDHYGGEQLQTNPQDRYQEQLGHRENFLVHAVLAVLSFIIFGSIPLVIYGLLIDKNYYAEVKLAIVAATSVICIILLAIGKVYTRRPTKSYIKTVLYYVTMALATSGLSYMAGNLFKDLLEKFDHSESGFVITMPISDTSMETALKSY